MPFLAHFAFDNSNRLGRNVHYFEYRGVRFKLIQNSPRRWADALLTLVPSHDSAEEQTAYSAAGEFLSALSWQNRARVTLQSGGGVPVRTGFRLRSATCRSFSFSQIPFAGHSTGWGISPIPLLETDDQRRALALFREAFSANKQWFSFLLYWQVLQVGAPQTGPVEWINRGVKKGSVEVPRRELEVLGISGRQLGEYLQGDCRDAIAHLQRRPGKRTLQIDVREETLRMAVSTTIVERFARHYISQELRLNKRAILVQRRAREFPTFAPEHGAT